jgi:hypothetical protein
MTTATAESSPQTEMATQEQPKPQSPARMIREVHDDGPLAFLMDTARFEHMGRIASSMALGSFLPEHLTTVGPKNSKRALTLEQIKANCFLIVNQALRWGVDPFALAPETYVVSNKLGYQGKLVAAIVNTRAGLEGRLAATYSGAGMDRTVTITGKFKDETQPRTIDLSVKQAKTDNAMWTSDPDQKLWYSGATKWARRHCPEVLLGVLTEDDVDRIEATAIRTVPMEVIEPERPASKSDALAQALAARNGSKTEEVGAPTVDEAPAGEESQEPPAEDLVPYWLGVITEAKDQPALMRKHEQFDGVRADLTTEQQEQIEAAFAARLGTFAATK